MSLRSTQPDCSTTGRRFARRWLLLACVAAAPLTNAWATREYVMPPPTLPVPMVVKIRPSEDLQKHAVPGPKSDMVLGYDNSVGLGLMFGALGVAAAAATQGGPGVPGLPSIALVEPARSIVEAWSSSRESQGRFFFEGGGEAGGPVLDIVPLAMLSFTDKERRTAQAFVLLYVNMMDGQKRVLWRTRYVASTGGVRPVSGEAGWTAQDGAALTAAMDASLRAGLRFLLQDLVTPLARAGGAPVSGEYYVPRQDKPWKFEGQALAQDNGGYVLIASSNHDNHVTGGLFVLERTRLGLMGELPTLRTTQTAVAVAAPAKAPVRRPAAPTIPSAPTAPAVATNPPPVSAEASAAPPDAGETPVRPRPVTAADVDGHTWRYAHPRDPARFGDVRLVFRDGQVNASNAKGKAHGIYELRDGKLCITYDANSWPASCLSLVEGAGGVPMLWTNTFARALPLVIE